jgi:hypothetical protein
VEQKILFFAMPSAFMGKELALCFHGQKAGTLLSWAETWHAMALLFLLFNLDFSLAFLFGPYYIKSMMT